MINKSYILFDFMKIFFSFISSDLEILKKYVEINKQVMIIVNIFNFLIFIPPEI